MPSSAQAGGQTPMCPLLTGQGHVCCFAELHKWELDSLSVQCPYSTAVDGTLVYSTDIKAWCRLDRTGCNILATTGDPSTQNHRKAQQSRVLIQDDTKKRTVTITMQKLQARDTGVYWCVLYATTHLIWIMQVKLSVSKSEYLLAAKCPCWRISAPPPLLVLPPVLRHRSARWGAQHCHRTADSPVPLSVPFCSSCLEAFTSMQHWQGSLAGKFKSPSNDYSSHRACDCSIG